MADNYKITQYSVNNILNYVENAQIAIPEIQRPFVWKGSEVCALIDSLYEGYPIGYLIVWQNSQVRVRGFGRGGTKKILIDGQQRVTALMAALTGREVLDEEYRSHRIKIAFLPLAAPDEERFAVCDASCEENPLWIPDISVLFRRDFSFRKFEKEYRDKNPGADFTNLEASIDRLRAITKHQVGIIELSFLLDIDVVSEIFIRINLQGKPLNQEDFAMSKISANEQYDGDLIRNGIDYFCHLLNEPSFLSILQENEKEFLASDYGKAVSWVTKDTATLYVPSYADVLKVVLIAYFGKSRVGELVNLLSGKQSAKGDVSKKLSEESFRTLGEGVRAFACEENFIGFSSALRRAGYSCGRLLYSQSVLNYCYAMYLIMAREGIPAADRERLAGKWMAYCLMTGHYQSAPESTVTKDCAQIAEAGFASYLKQLEKRDLTPEFYGTILPEKYRSTAPRTAAYLAYLAAQGAQGAPSLYDPETKLIDLYREKGETSQILPKAFLAQCGFTAREFYGQQANLTYLSKETKAVVRKKSPAEYREALCEKCDPETVAATLLANDVPEEIFLADAENVESILRARREKMAQKMKTYYEAL